MIQWTKIDVEYFLGVKDAIETIRDFSSTTHFFKDKNFAPLEKELLNQEISHILMNVWEQINNLGDKMEKDYETHR